MVDNYFQIEEKTLEDEWTPTPAMIKAQKFLDDLGVEYEVKSEFHIKIKYLNYFPTRGSVNLDGQKKFKNKGLEFLKNLLVREGLI